MIWIGRTGGEYVVEQDDTVVRAATARGLATVANQLGEANPFRLAPGASVAVEVNQDDRAVLLGALLPLLQHEDELRTRWADEKDGVDFVYENSALDGGPVVNGEPWGWIWDGQRPLVGMFVAGGPCRSSPGTRSCGCSLRSRRQ